MASADLNTNPLLSPFQGPEACIPFEGNTRFGSLDALKLEHFVPAIDQGIAWARERLKSIQNAQDPVSFENTALALETISEELDLSAETYFNLFSAEADAAFQALAKEISPKLAAFSNDISLDPAVFARVKALYDKRDALGLNQEQRQLVEKQYKGFVRNGALLDAKSTKSSRPWDRSSPRIF